MDDKPTTADVALAVLLKLIETGQNISMTSSNLAAVSWDIADAWNRFRDERSGNA